MNTYTIFAYIIPAGGHHVETVTATDASTAALQLRARLGLAMREFEVVAVVRGAVMFEPVDEKQFALAPFSPDSP